MSPCIYFSFVFGEALELAYILLFGIPIYLTLSCIKIWIKKKKNAVTQGRTQVCKSGEDLGFVQHQNGLRITVRRKKPVHEAKESPGSGAHRFNVKRP